ncbi:glutathione S-transferase [Collimonas sp. OK242]|jgi:glutathione S-transferase|uniref:glutathione binding-like protein n=1 Tax=Collimonas sp. OK242 TaxID=1798195 RepID=UPI000894B846|nr:glutathione binding-like protein [Collimonas sp. OK242]SDY54819.1 glutathione S-transferase [Collimonas sp. OK242]
MNLYFSPLACSMATRIAFYEADAKVDYIQVDTKLKQLQDGADFYAINALGQVPVLRTGDGTLLSENTAILPYVAELFPEAQLTPSDRLQRAKMQQWLGFISTELHKALFVPLLDPHASEPVKIYAREHAALRLGHLQEHFIAHEFLLDRFSVADAYLVTVLNWAPYCGIDLAQWPQLKAYYDRQLQRPSIAKALAEELALYRAKS